MGFIVLRIAYDHQIFSWQEYGGISRYFVEVATRLSKTPDHDVTVLAPLYVNRYLKESTGLGVIGIPIPKLPKAGRALQKLNAGLVRGLLRSVRPDVVHETYYYERKLARPQTPTVVTVHDMIYEKFPSDYPRWDSTSDRKRRAVQRADRVICVSENTKKDLVDIFKVDAGKVTVIYHGYSLSIASDLRPKPLCQGLYLAYVGLRGGYKNFDGLLRAFASSKRLMTEFRIVCVGGGRLVDSERRRIRELGIPDDRVLQLSGDDATLANIYRHAFALVYPSLYEGFGMPPLEAMACLCPIICSNTSSLPEVCGDAAEYFDPHAADSIRDAIERVVGSETRRTELTSAALRQTKRFSWDICAEETAAVYSSLTGAAAPASVRPR